MPIKITVLNNNELGKITEDQDAGGWDKWVTDFVIPGFTAFADNYGGSGVEVRKEEYFDDSREPPSPRTGLAC